MQAGKSNNQNNIAITGVLKALLITRHTNNNTHYTANEDINAGNKSYKTDMQQEYQKRRKESEFQKISNKIAFDNAIMILFFFNNKIPINDNNNGNTDTSLTHKTEKTTSD